MTIKRLLKRALIISILVALSAIIGIVCLAIYIVCLAIYIVCLAVYIAIKVVLGIIDYINWSAENYYPYIAKYGRRNAFTYYCMDNNKK